MPSSFPINVCNGIGAPLEADAETVFLQRVFRCLEAQMVGDFQRFTFVVHRRVRGEIAGAPIRLNPGDSNKILILLADEKEVFPVEDYTSYRVIFRSYGNPKGGDTRIHPFPVGYLNAAGLAQPVSFNDRKCSVFFSGYMNRNRVDLYKQFRPTFWLPRRNLKTRHTRELSRRIIERFYTQRSFDDVIPGAKIHFTNGFGKGLTPEEYAGILAHSKIAICPPGFVSHETIRHWEAMRLGCVIISAPLPPNRFYKDSPIIQLSDWSKLKPLIEDFSNHPEELLKAHEKTMKWWNDVCSEDAIANYMAKVILKS